MLTRRVFSYSSLLLLLALLLLRGQWQPTLLQCAHARHSHLLHLLLGLALLEEGRVHLAESRLELVQLPALEDATHEAALHEDDVAQLCRLPRADALTGVALKEDDLHAVLLCPLAHFGDSEIPRARPRGEEREEGGDLVLGGRSSSAHGQRGALAMRSQCLGEHRLATGIVLVAAGEVGAGLLVVAHVGAHEGLVLLLQSHLTTLDDELHSTHAHQPIEAPHLAMLRAHHCIASRHRSDGSRRARADLLELAQHVHNIRALGVKASEGLLVLREGEHVSVRLDLERERREVNDLGEDLLLRAGKVAILIILQPLTRLDADGSDAAKLLTLLLRSQQDGVHLDHAPECNHVVRGGDDGGEALAQGDEHVRHLCARVGERSNLRFHLGRKERKLARLGLITRYLGRITRRLGSGDGCAQGRNTILIECVCALTLRLDRRLEARLDLGDLLPPALMSLLPGRARLHPARMRLLPTLYWLLGLLGLLGQVRWVDVPRLKVAVRTQLCNRCLLHMHCRLKSLHLWPHSLLQQQVNPLAIGPAALKRCIEHLKLHLLGSDASVELKQSLQVVGQLPEQRLLLLQAPNELVLFAEQRIPRVLEPHPRHIKRGEQVLWPKQPPSGAHLAATLHVALAATLLAALATHLYHIWQLARACAGRDHLPAGSLVK